MTQRLGTKRAMAGSSWSCAFVADSHGHRDHSLHTVGVTEEQTEPQATEPPSICSGGCRAAQGHKHASSELKLLPLCKGAGPVAVSTSY